MSDKQENKETKPLDDGDINLLKKYGMGPYSESIKTLEEENKTMVTTINKMCGIKESDTGLSLPSQWDLVADQKLASVLFQNHIIRNTHLLQLDATKFSNPPFKIKISTWSPSSIQPNTLLVLAKRQLLQTLKKA